MKIWGDHFNQDTRALLAACQMADTEIDFELIDTIDGQNNKAPYIEMNPSATIPMLSQGHSKVIGDGISIFNYILNVDEKLSEKFDHEAQRNRVNEILHYFQRLVRRVTSKLVQVIVVPKVTNQPCKVSAERIDEYLVEFFNLILEKIDNYLPDSEYITGPKISIVDLIVFFEINTICLMYNRDVPEKFAKLVTWYNKLTSLQSIHDQTEKFKAVLDQHGLYYAGS